MMESIAQTELVEKKEPVHDPALKDEGSRQIFEGRDYAATRVIVVPSTFKNAEDGEKHIYLSQGRGAGISLSLKTIEDIVLWAKSPENQS